MKVSVIGGGNGGYALAFHMSKLGHDVLLYQHPQRRAKIDETISTGIIVAEPKEGEYTAALSGTATIDKATYDIKEAIEYSDIAVFVVPAFGQISLFEQSLPYFKDDHIIINLPGNFASLEYAQIMEDRGINKRLKLVDTSTIPYACRRLSGSRVFISGLKVGMHIGVFPGKFTDAVIDRISPLFDLKIHKSKNVIEAALSNTNLPLHPAGVLFNTGWVEATGGNFGFYSDGFTESVGRFSEAVDREKVMLGKKIDLKLMNCVQCLKFFYGDTNDKTIHQFVSRAKHYKFFKAPPSLENRYVTEDLAYLIVPTVRYIFKRAGIESPAMNAMIKCAEILTGKKIRPERHFTVILKDGETVEDMNRRLQFWLD